MKIKLPETIVETELLKILEAEKYPKLRLAYALGFYECMRIGEIIKLTPQDIDRSLKLIHIKEGKGGKDRNIPISPKVLSGLKHLPMNFSLRTLQRKFKAIGIKILNKDLHFHILRHSGVTHYLVKERWSSLEVQRLAGHSKIATTQIYTHINPVDLVNRMWE